MRCPLSCLKKTLQTKAPEYSVLDGGSLLQRFPRKRGTTFDSIATTCVDYVQKNFSNAIIVFDGYESGCSTKNVTYLRRSKGAVGSKVIFTGSMVLKSQKEQF
jgi:hypothetical protein